MTVEIDDLTARENNYGCRINSYGNDHIQISIWGTVSYQLVIDIGTLSVMASAINSYLLLQKSK